MRTLTRPRPLALAVLIAGATLARAAEPPARCDAGQRTALTLSLYDGGLGLVQDTRSLELPAGTHEVEFADVPALLDPSSVLVRTAQGPPLRLVEQRYEQDLLGPDRLLELAVGGPVKLVTRDDAGETTTVATLLSTRGPLYEIGGEIWLGHPGQVVIPERPAGLRERPALSWSLEARQSGSRSLQATYLTGGLGWSAAYAARLDAGEKSLSLQGWATLENGSGVPFQGARLNLVAGDVRRTPRPRMERAVLNAEMAVAAAGDFQEQAVFERHVYTLEGTVDLPERVPTQVPLREAASIPFRKALILRGGMYHPRGSVAATMGMHPEIEVEITNEGGPLPAGILRFYQETATGLLFLGEDRIGHTAGGGTARVVLGTAFDVEADRIPTEVQAVSAGRYDREVAFRIEIRNHKPDAVAVELREAVPGDWKLLQSSPEGRRLDAQTLGFEVSVPARGETVVTYRVAIDMG